MDACTLYCNILLANINCLPVIEIATIKTKQQKDESIFYISETRTDCVYLYHAARHDVINNCAT